MMDIVERLRDSAALPTGLYAEAADEIDRLRAELDNPAIVRQVIDQQNEIDHLRDEVVALKQTVAMSVARHLYDEVCAEVEVLREVFDAAENLVKVKGRYHAEMAYKRLAAAVDAVDAAMKNGETQ